MNRESWIAACFLLIIAGLTIQPWLNEGLPATDDFRHHVTKFWWLDHELEGDQTITEWQPNIYSGWPMTHFYHSLPYFVTLPFTFFTSPVEMLKFDMVLAMLLALVTMYLATKKLTARTDIALLSAFFYSLSPLHFEFAFLSGSISRQWAYTLVPLALVFFIEAVEKKEWRSTALAALSYAALMWTHLNVAYAMAVMYALYLLYIFYIHYSTSTKTVDKHLLKHLIGFAILSLALIAFWLIPLVTESAESEIRGRTQSVFGFAPAGLPLRALFARSFGIEAVNNAPMRHFYIGWALLILALAGLAVKNVPKRTPLIIIAALGLFFTVVTAPLKLLPLLLIDYPIYFLMIALVPITIFAAYGVTGIAKATGYKEIVLGVLLIIALIDVYPAFSTHQWINAPTDDFMNPPQLINVWNFIKEQPGEFRVYSLVGEAPFMFHEKYEVGTTWMGFREGALRPIRQITDKLEETFRNNPTSKEAKEILEYFGVRYLVLPCTQGLEQTYPIAYAFEGACAYSVNGAPLVSAVKIVENKDPFTSGINVSEAVLAADAAPAPLSPNELTLKQNNKSNSTLEHFENGQNGERVTITNLIWTPESITFTTKANKSANILIRSAYFKPHWHAYVDGKETQIKEVWPKYITIEVGAGAREVELRYETSRTHILSGIISTMALLWAIVLLLKFKNKVA